MKSLRCIEVRVQSLLAIRSRLKGDPPLVLSTCPCSTCSWWRLLKLIVFRLLQKAKKRAREDANERLLKGYMRWWWCRLSWQGAISLLNKLVRSPSSQAGSLNKAGKGQKVSDWLPLNLFTNLFKLRQLELRVLQAVSIVRQHLIGRWWDS